MNRWRTFLGGVLVFLLVGCAPPVASGGDASTDTSLTDTASLDGATTPTDASGVSDVPVVNADGAPVQTHMYRSSIGPIRMMPGEEWTQCVLRRLNNETMQYVRRIRAHLGNASHHLIVFRSNETEEQLTPRPCRGFSGLTENFTNPEAPYLIAQQAEAELRFPNGVGMAAAANQMLRLEFHAINLSDQPVEAMGSVDFETTDASEPVYAADVMFWGNTGINLPARQRSTVEMFHSPLPGIRIFGMTSHTHKMGATPANTIHLGTGTRTPSMVPGVSFLGTSWSNITDTRELHRSTNWSDPPLTTFDPPLQLSGNQGLHLRCNYNNNTDSVVRFGESANQEMCFLWAYYYPAPRGTQVCARGFVGSDRNNDTVLCYPP